jgi:hypothetical protein
MPNDSAQFSHDSALSVAMTRATTFAIGVLLLYAVALPVHAATIRVTNTNDSGPGSLRQALTIANDGDTIGFAVTGTINLTSGELVIDKNIIISGPGPVFSPLPDLSKPLTSAYSIFRPVIRPKSTD